MTRLFRDPIATQVDKAKRRPSWTTLWFEFLGPDRSETRVSGDTQYNIQHGYCGLCGNKGVIDTRGHVHTAAGLECGVRRWCICPNGRALKRGHKSDAP